jgi:hypothetical protein
MRVSLGVKVFDSCFETLAANCQPGAMDTAATSSYNAISVPPILRPGVPGYDCDSHKPARSADVDR